MPAAARSPLPVLLLALLTVVILTAITAAEGTEESQSEIEDEDKHSSSAAGSHGVAETTSDARGHWRSREDVGRVAGNDAGDPVQMSIPANAASPANVTSSVDATSVDVISSTGVINLADILNLVRLSSPVNITSSANASRPVNATSIDNATSPANTTTTNVTSPANVTTLANVTILANVTSLTNNTTHVNVTSPSTKSFRSAPKKRTRKGPKPRIRIRKVYKKVWRRRRRRRKPKRKTTPKPSVSPPPETSPPNVTTSPIETTAGKPEPPIPVENTISKNVATEKAPVVPNIEQSPADKYSNHKTDRISINVPSTSIVKADMKNVTKQNGAVSKSPQQTITDRFPENRQSNTIQPLGIVRNAPSRVPADRFANVSRNSNSKESDLPARKSPHDITTESDSKNEPQAVIQNSQTTPIEDTLNRFYNSDFEEDKTINQSNGLTGKQSPRLTKEKVGNNTAETSILGEQKDDISVTRDSLDINFPSVLPIPADSLSLPESVESMHSLKTSNTKLQEKKITQREEEPRNSESVSIGDKSGELKNVSKSQQHKLEEIGSNDDQSIEQGENVSVQRGSTTSTGAPITPDSNIQNNSGIEVSERFFDFESGEDITTVRQLSRKKTLHRKLNDTSLISDEMMQSRRLQNNSDNFSRFRNVDNLFATGTTERSSSAELRHPNDNSGGTISNVMKTQEPEVLPLERMLIDGEVSHLTQIQNNSASAKNHSEPNVNESVTSERVFVGEPNEVVYQENKPSDLNVTSRVSSSNLHHSQNTPVKNSSENISEISGTSEVRNTISDISDYSRTTVDSAHRFNQDNSGVLEERHKTCYYPMHLRPLPYQKTILTETNQMKILNLPKICEVGKRKWNLSDKEENGLEELTIQKSREWVNLQTLVCNKTNGVFENAIPLIKGSTWNPYFSQHPSPGTKYQNNVFPSAPNPTLDFYFPPLLHVRHSFILPVSPRMQPFIPPNRFVDSSVFQSGSALGNARALSPGPINSPVTRSDSYESSPTPFVEDGVPDSDYEHLLEDIENRTVNLDDVYDNLDDLEANHGSSATGRRVWSSSTAVGNEHVRRGMGLPEGAMLFMGKSAFRPPLEESSGGWSPPKAPLVARERRPSESPDVPWRTQDLATLLGMPPTPSQLPLNVEWKLPAMAPQDSQQWRGSTRTSAYGTSAHLGMGSLPSLPDTISPHPPQFPLLPPHHTLPFLPLNPSLLPIHSSISHRLPLLLRDNLISLPLLNSPLPSPFLPQRIPSLPLLSALHPHTALFPYTSLRLSHSSPLLPLPPIQLPPIPLLLSPPPIQLPLLPPPPLPHIPLNPLLPPINLPPLPLSPIYLPPRALLPSFLPSSLPPLHLPPLPPLLPLPPIQHPFLPMFPLQSALRTGVPSVSDSTQIISMSPSG